MFLKLHQLSQSKIERLVGAKSDRLVKGSTALFVKTIMSDEAPDDLVGAKVNFELRKKGLLMYISKSSKRWVKTIPAGEILKVSMTGGEDRFIPRTVSLMKLLMNAGMSIRYARYFQFRKLRREYDVTPILLILQTENISLGLETSGYNNYSLMDFVSQVEVLTGS